MELLRNGDCRIYFDDLGQFALSAEKVEATLNACPNFALYIDGQDQGQRDGQMAAYTLASHFALKNCLKNSEETVFIYEHDKLSLRVEVSFLPIQGTNAFRMHTVLLNQGEEPITSSLFSSAFIQGIGLGGKTDWTDPERFTLYRGRQTWQGEDEWIKASLPESGIMRVSMHECSSALQISSRGTFTTAANLPLLFIQDNELKQTYYFQLEPLTDWHIECGYRNPAGDSSGSLYVEADGINERFLGTTVTLQPGERYEGERLSFGVVKGDFETAVADLWKVRRALAKTCSYPVMFNDYMNCKWGESDGEYIRRVLPLVKQIGCEGYCIDEGWYRGLGKSGPLGEWLPCDERFGEGGFQGIVDLANSLGLRFGVWTELEVCSPSAEVCKNDDSWFVLRRGKRICAGGRFFFNFTNPQVCSYLENRIYSLYKMGVRYIKNDYNACYGSSPDDIPQSSDNARAFFAMIDRISNSCPDLIWENCASGVMRQDYGTLAHFHLQSTSDQEFCSLYPFIAVGAMVSLIPEQAGIWAYPMPNLFDTRSDSSKFGALRQQMQDGEETILNMTTAMLGNLYLSGRIEEADGKNFALIEEGVACFRRIRKDTFRGEPAFPCGLPHIRAAGRIMFAAGIRSGSRLYLAVWRLGSQEDTLEIPLARYFPLSCEQIYPEGESYRVPCKLKDNVLRPTLSQKFSARLFCLRLSNNADKQ